ncbi:MAG TPA: cytochrome P450 [Stackebrandtia sp.]|uniref:cytochrome P450 n=1 Tax=Stackebrandtia sp. TaxID=2023065 RepID=UPI002D3CFE2C|nr:cytochrome P450 [Stackebrandtia sp.]HZE37617.1 cytochrome P450 [Stackebrandtia sp.]
MTFTPDIPLDGLPIPRDAGCPFDPPGALTQLAADRPIGRMTYPDGHLGWLVTDHALSQRVLADPRFSHRVELRHAPVQEGTLPTDDRSTPPGFFAVMDAPEHTRYRRLLTGYFTMRRMRRLEARISEITERHLDTMARAEPPVDLVCAFALPIPSLVICELLGVPYADHGRFQAITARLVSTREDPDSQHVAMRDLHSYLADLVRRKHSHPDDGILSALVDGGELDDTEITSIGIILLVAGHETTANMIGLGTWALLRHPEQLARLRANPDLMDGAVDELLRYLTIVQFGLHRAALEDLELGGQAIGAGETVTVAASVANRDPRVFGGGDRLLVERDNARRHLAFGHGIHQCLGQQLARIELRVAYSGLLGRFEGLRPAVDDAEIPLRERAFTYGVHRLPVTWDSVTE